MIVFKIIYRTTITSDGFSSVCSMTNNLIYIIYSYNFVIHYIYSRQLTQPEIRRFSVKRVDDVTCLKQFE